MVVRYAVIKDVGRWSVCLPGFKTTAVFLFAMTASLRIILLLFISLASLFSSEIIFEMCSTKIIPPTFINQSEDQLDKGYDPKVARGLLRFLKPYYGPMSISLLFMVIVTFASVS